MTKDQDEFLAKARILGLQDAEIAFLNEQVTALAHGDTAAAVLCDWAIAVLRRRCPALTQQQARKQETP